MRRAHSILDSEFAEPMGRSNQRNRSKQAIRKAPAHGRSDDGRAFLPDPYDGTGAPARAADPLAETLAEEFVEAATNAEEMTEDDRDQLMPEEVGGPFTQTSAAEEFAGGTDASNPADAEREPFPTVTRQPS
jgi:hypothetical protein